MKHEEKPMDFQKQILRGQVVSEMNFLQKVWAICARIPAGKVMTYGGIARRLKSKGFRAVGMALNRNPYAPKVPCHRVVGKDGSLTGFASGLAKKKAMLLAEGVKFVGTKVDMGACGVGEE